MPRPVQRFANFIGFSKQIKPLIEQYEGAQRRGEACPHTGLFGPSGVGKTTLAEALATTFGVALILANGFDTASELKAKTESAPNHAFLFIDESHNLTPAAQEFLYEVMDRQHIVPVDPAATHVTILLATDQPGRLRNALQKRLEVTVMLGHYREREMAAITDGLARELGVQLSPQARNLLAKTAGGIPRVVRHHLHNLRRRFMTGGDITVAQVRVFLKGLGIDRRGMMPIHRKYLRFVGRMTKASLESIALHLGVDCEFVRQQIESLLQYLGMIEIGSGGRTLSPRGLRWFKQRRRQ